MCVVQKQAGLYTKRLKRLQNQNCLGQVFTSAFCLALLMEVERCLPVSLSPGLLQHYSWLKRPSMLKVNGMPYSQKVAFSNVLH